MNEVDLLINGDGLQPRRGGPSNRPALAEFERRTALRRAREAALAYERRSEALLSASPGGLMALSGSQAADGYDAWAKRDSEARVECGARLDRGAYALYLALTGKTAADAARLASSWAAAQGREAHAALIRRELFRLGEETVAGALTLAARAALIEAARPAARRLAAELAGALGREKAALPTLFGEAMALVARAAVARAAMDDPLAGAALLEAAGEYLPPSDRAELSRRLKAPVERALALDAAEAALSRAGSVELATHLIEEMALPPAVCEAAKALARSELAARALSVRRREIGAELEARNLLALPGATLAALPTALWAALSPRSREELSTGAARTTDATTFAELAGLAVARPGEFAALDLTPYFYRLAPADYALLANHAERLKVEPEASPPRRIAEGAAKRPSPPPKAAKPPEAVVDAMGRHLAKLTGRRPARRCWEMCALAAGLSHAGLIDHRAGSAILNELVTVIPERS